MIAPARVKRAADGEQGRCSPGCVWAGESRFDQVGHFGAAGVAERFERGTLQVWVALLADVFEQNLLHLELERGWDSLFFSKFDKLPKNGGRFGADSHIRVV